MLSELGQTLTIRLVIDGRWAMTAKRVLSRRVLAGCVFGLVMVLCLEGCGVSSSRSATGSRPGMSSRPTTEPAKELTLDLGSGVTTKLALIPVGKFLMGSPADEEGRQSDEGPQHEVTISKPFYLGVCEVTQEQYKAVIGSNPSHFRGLHNPVENVSWDDAIEFCRRLSNKTGYAVRLPTEAEWEYACRAGTTTPFHTGQTISTSQANYVGGLFVYGHGREGIFREKTMAVGSFKPNAWGLYDMHGNVWEWCGDWYAYSYTDANQADPAGPACGEFRVARGGGWNCIPHGCRSATRVGFIPDGRDSGIGFRVAVDLK